MDMSDAPAIRRAVAVFELLAGSRRGLSLSEVSRKLEMPKSSTHRILNTLEQTACIHKNHENGRYYLGVKLIGLSRAIVEGLELRETATPLLAGLMKRTKLTVHMAVLEHGQAVLVAKLEPPNQPSVGTWVGRAMDANSTAAGKALIAYLSPSELAKQFKSGTFVRHNSKTIVTMQQLKAELARIRQIGYSLDDEEDELGTRCVGAPVFDRSGKVAAAISVVGFTEQVSHTRLESLAEAVKQTAAAISARLGATAG
jgi:DNA-binding IclR family transcriptional regulator